MHTQIWLKRQYGVEHQMFKRGGAMQVHYVVEFEIQRRGAVDDLYAATLNSVASWLSFVASKGVDQESLEVSGRLALQPNRSGSPRSAVWEVVGTEETRAIRIEVRDEDQASDSVFVTRLTLGQVGSKTMVRVSMARETSPTWLSPAPPPDLRQPGVVRSLLKNDQIELTIIGQLQDGRYIQVRTDAEVSNLAAAIRGNSRLPILLVHTRTLPALAAARTTAEKLVGLVRVVTLDYRASQALEAQLPGYAPPRAGARLVWSDSSAPTVSFNESKVNSEDSDVLRAHLMRLLAPVSVLARGLDRAFRTARHAEIAQKDRAARTQTEHALAAGNASAQLEALREELDTVRINAEEWERLATEEEERADRFQVEAEKVPALEAQIEQLTIAIRALPAPTHNDPNDEEDPWATPPELVTSDAPSAESLFIHLEDIASGHIAFTDRAPLSWKKSKYPFPEEMTECLVKLARVSTVLYDENERSYPHLDTWIRDEFDLKVALQDDTIEKTPKFRDFDYDGTTYNRTPHVKVRDHTAPSQVGRIHFALDHENRRLIVDHVGLKLY